MSKRIENLKKSAEDNGIESISYDEQMEIALYLAEKYGDSEPVYQWFEDRYELNYSRERTEAHLRKILELRGNDHPDQDLNSSSNYVNVICQ